MSSSRGSRPGPSSLRPSAAAGHAGVPSASRAPELGLQRPGPRARRPRVLLGELRRCLALVQLGLGRRSAVTPARRPPPRARPRSRERGGVESHLVQPGAAPRRDQAGEHAGALAELVELAGQAGPSRPALAPAPAPTPGRSSSASRSSRSQLRLGRRRPPPPQAPSASARSASAAPAALRRAAMSAARHHGDAALARQLDLVPARSARAARRGSQPGPPRGGRARGVAAAPGGWPWRRARPPRSLPLLRLAHRLEPGLCRRVGRQLGRLGDLGLGRLDLARRGLEAGGLGAPARARGAAPQSRLASSAASRPWSRVLPAPRPRRTLGSGQPHHASRLCARVAAASPAWPRPPPARPRARRRASIAPAAWLSQHGAARLEPLARRWAAPVQRVDACHRRPASRGRGRAWPSSSEGRTAVAAQLAPAARPAPPSRLATLRRSASISPPGAPRGPRLPSGRRSPASASRTARSAPHRGPGAAGRTGRRQRPELPPRWPPRCGPWPRRPSRPKPAKVVPWSIQNSAARPWCSGRRRRGPCRRSKRKSSCSGPRPRRRRSAARGAGEVAPPGGTPCAGERPPPISNSTSTSGVTPAVSGAIASRTAPPTLWCSNRAALSAASRSTCPPRCRPTTTVSPSSRPSSTTGPFELAEVADLEPAQPHLPASTALASTKRSRSARARRPRPRPSARSGKLAQAARGGGRAGIASERRGRRPSGSSRRPLSSTSRQASSRSRCSSSGRAPRAGEAEQPCRQLHELQSVGEVAQRAAKLAAGSPSASWRRRAQPRASDGRRWQRAPPYGAAPGAVELDQQRLAGRWPWKRSGSGVPAYQVRAAISSVPCQSPSAR